MRSSASYVVSSNSDFISRNYQILFFKLLQLIFASTTSSWQQILLIAVGYFSSRVVALRAHHCCVCRGLIWLRHTTPKHHVRQL
jgi:hypothetical protein